MSSFNWSPIAGGTGGVTTINSLSGALTLAAGTGIAITDNGTNTITIASTSAGDLTLTAFGSTPSANAASLSGQALTLQPADATHPGGVSITTQAFAGNKTFTGTIAASNLSGTNTGDVTLAAVGSSPNANGASLSAQVLNLQPADATNPGVVTTASQTFAGQKTFSTGLTGTLTGAASLNVLTSALGNLTDAGTDGIVVTGGTGAVVGSVSLAQHVADSTHNGYLSSTDWSTFNGKQAAGNYITALTGDATASGPGSAALTLATVNSNVGSFAISTVTVNGKGLVTAASAASTTGSGAVVLASAPTMTNPVVGTQTQGDASTKAASTAYVDTAITNAIAGVNPAVAVQAATTANLSGYTYSNGVSGIGATLTAGSTNTALTVDGYTFTAVNQRLLVKDQTTSANNGVYFVTQVQGVALPVILTRALDYDTPSDMNNTGAIPVENGTVNAITQWVLTSLVTTVGTDPLTFTRFTRNPADYLLVANNLSDVASSSTSFNNISGMTTLGDLVYGGASGTRSVLAGNTTTTKKYLSQTGNGSVSAAPAWAQVAFADLSGSVSAAQMPALTGDVTTSAGAVATTLATVNANVGSFALATVTVNAKGLTTAASAASTTGTGSVVLSASPTMTGTTNVGTLAASTFVYAGGQTFSETIGASISTNAVVCGLYSSSNAYTSAIITAQTETAAGTGWKIFKGNAAGGSNVFNVLGNGNVQNTNNSYAAISDLKLKENIIDARDYTEDLNRLRVVKYSFKSEKSSVPTQIGLIAQEVELIFPGLIEETEDEDMQGNKLGTTTKAIKYSILVPMLLKTIQSLTARIEALEAK